MTEATDDELMRAFAAGDAHAFDTLYARHQAALYRFVHRLLGRAAGTQADEVFQDTWLRAIQARHTWQPQGAAWRTWLFTLAPHRAIDCLRKEGREVSLVTNQPGAAAAIVLDGLRRSAARRTRTQEIQVAADARQQLESAAALFRQDASRH